MNSFILRLVACSVLALLISGCDTVRNTWSKTTDLYETYLDPKPEVDLQRRPGLSKREKHLATQFSAIDQQLELLLRTVAPQDTFPPPAWFNEVDARFSWLTAVAAVDTQGGMLAQYPESPLKTVKGEPLVEREWSIMNRGLQGFVQNTPLGPEMIVAGPFFRDGIWRGLLVAHFDPRSLVNLAPNPDDLILFVPGEVLWSGPDMATTQELLDAPWEEILRSRVQGRWSSENTTFAWIARPIGELRLVYAVSVE